MSTCPECNTFLGSAGHREGCSNTGLSPVPSNDLLGCAITFRDAAFAYLTAIADDKVCINRTCLRCRIADAVFDVEEKHDLKPN